MIPLRRKLSVIFALSFVFPMKLIRSIKRCLCETYNTVRVVELLSGMFPFKTVLIKGDALWSLLIRFALECAFRRVQVNQMGLKLSGTHRLLDYVDDVNVLAGSTHTAYEEKRRIVSSC
jgi:hypothetical protein